MRGSGEVTAPLVRIKFLWLTTKPEALYRYKFDNPSHNKKWLTVTTRLIDHSEVHLCMLYITPIVQIDRIYRYSQFFLGAQVRVEPHFRKKMP